MNNEFNPKEKEDNYKIIYNRNYNYITAIKSNVCFAEGGIGTAEVQTATDNIKRVITSIAMPLRRNFNFCKYRSSSLKNDSKC